MNWIQLAYKISDLRAENAQLDRQLVEELERAEKNQERGDEKYFAKATGHAKRIGGDKG
jgi:hypothetical protein